jgi:hypothetical protein
VTARSLALVVMLSVLGVLALPGSTGAAPPHAAPPNPICTPAPSDCSAWHTADVTITWAAPPPEVEWTVGCTKTTFTTDTAGAAASCEWWNADGSTERTVFVRRDATPPNAEARAGRGPDANGWYNRSLAIEFLGSDGMSGLAGCSSAHVYNGPDSATATVTGTCTDRAGNSRTVAFGLQYDATAPNVTPKPERNPDRKGWYNRRVRVSFVGSDATSGVASCAPDVTYGGPDADKTALSGTCTDRAANTSSAAQFELRFDTKPPALKRPKAEPRRKDILVRWAASEDASSFEIARSPGLHGSPWSKLYGGEKSSFVDGRVSEGVRYRYRVTAFDDAGNATVKDVLARARTTELATARSKGSRAVPALVRPANGARLGAPPVLVWRAVGNATYYNVQLFRNGKKVLTAWPRSRSLKLSSSWRFEGRTHRLSPGRYRWYVWPGFGPRSASRYGKLVGTRTFVVTR